MSQYWAVQLDETKDTAGATYVVGTMSEAEELTTLARLVMPDDSDDKPVAWYEELSCNTDPNDWGTRAELLEDLEAEIHRQRAALDVLHLRVKSLIR